MVRTRHTRRLGDAAAWPLVIALLVGLSACVGEAAEPQCVFPVEPTVVLEEDGSILLTWEFSADTVFSSEAVLPEDSAFAAYRAVMVRDGADLRRPIADPPQPADEAEAAIWRDEHFNNDLAYEQAVGTIGRITCLDALLFSVQANRRSPIEHPAEFLASVMRRSQGGGSEVAVIFGAGPEMFPPRAVYGFDVVEEYLANGWDYRYAIHNHTPQRNGDRVALGVPVPSTSDVSLTRMLGQNLGLDSVRVTNGLYTFAAAVDDLADFRAR